jgi:geranylgeranyl diphosphate synthase type I
MRTAALMAEIDREMLRLVQVKCGTAPGFREMTDYHFGWDRIGANTGKKIRPLLVVLAARAVGGSHEHAMKAAIGLQVIHEFTLVLDDIMDQDEIRRHRPTVWTRYGVNNAMTVGTGLYTIGFAALADQLRQSPGGLEATKVILDHCLLTHHAQLDDLAFERTFDVTLEECVGTAYGRSGLIACAAEVGAILGGASERVALAYRAFGRAFATAYSLHDDCRGLWGDEAELGKPVGSDIRQRKKTYPVLAGHRASTAAGRRRIEGIYAQPVLSEADVVEVVGILDRASARERTVAAVESFHQEAREALEATGIDNADQHALAALVAQALDLREGAAACAPVSPA